MRVVAHRGSDSPVQTTPRALQGSPVVRPNLFRLLGLAITLFSSLSRADYTTTLNPTNTYGTWDGWGASLCWWARVFGTRNDLADLMFTTNFVTLNGQSLPGLGLTMARYNLGACTTNSINGDHIQLSANIPAHRQMPGYWLDWFSSDPASTSWNWTADANQLSMLQKAKARGVNLFELFSNEVTCYYVVTASSGGGESGSSSEVPVTPHAPPRLLVSSVLPGSQVMLMWPAWATNYGPYGTTNLLAPAWQSVTGSTQTVNGMIRLTLPAGSKRSQFFRLVAPQ